MRERASAPIAPMPPIQRSAATFAASATSLATGIVRANFTALLVGRWASDVRAMAAARARHEDQPLPASGRGRDHGRGWV